MSPLRRILRRDYLTRMDWDFTLRDLACMSREALGADEAFVALLDGPSGAWQAWTPERDRLDEEAIALIGSCTVLRSVQASARPLLTTVDSPLPFRSQSILARGVDAVLAVPLFFWDAGAAEPHRHLGGCLYVHRTVERGLFDQEDVELVLDITEVAQRTLNLLRHLGTVQQDLNRAREELAQLRPADPVALCGLTTRDARFAREVLMPLDRATRFDGVGVLLLGPSGAGKSHLARAFHACSQRRGRPFVVLDCGQATSPETLAAELFGYAPRSGYANAPPGGRPGKAQQADGGILFIDEVASLPLELQRQLLRLLQDGRFPPLGGGGEAQVDLQIIAATNEDLSALIKAGRFREDLFWRLGELTVTLPSLEARRADLPDLARDLLLAACHRFGRQPPLQLSPEAVDRLRGLPWGRLGNLRGLERALSRAVLLADEQARWLDAADLPLEEGPHDPVAGATPAGAETGPLLRARLLHHGGSLSALSRDQPLRARLGYGAREIPRSSLAALIQRHGLRELAAELRRQRAPALDAVLEEIRLRGSATAAAERLGMSRDALIYQLRRAGLTVRAVLRRGGGDG